MVFSARISEKEARIRNHSGKFHTLDRNTRGLSRKSIVDPRVGDKLRTGAGGVPALIAS